MRPLSAWTVRSISAHAAASPAVCFRGDIVGIAKHCVFDAPHVRPSALGAM
ncbi:MAG: hypothetical protein ACFFBV_16380 [Promethearchaeota archaeon]